MKRRDFLKVAGTVGVLPALPGSAGGARLEIVTPLFKQAAWQDFELGLVYHFDLDVYMPGGHQHERLHRDDLDPGLYNPVRPDTDGGFCVRVSPADTSAFSSSTRLKW